MRKKTIDGLNIYIILIFLLISCGGGGGGTSSSSSNDDAPGDTETETRTIHEDPDDYVLYGSDFVQIQLNHNSITVIGDGTEINGSTITIKAGGEYQITGTLDDGRIIVDSDDDETVKLILNGIDIHSATNAPVSILKAEKTILFLSDTTDNRVTDADTYIFDDPEDDEPNAAIFSKDNLTIFGNGSLTVVGNYSHGISSKDGLIIASGTITVDAVEDGIRGKDYLVINDGNVTVTAGGDGFKSNNDDPLTGYIEVHNGTFDITAGADGIQAESDITIESGIFHVLSGGGSSAVIDDESSAKGIKAETDITINGGTFFIDSADDTLNANSRIAIYDGVFTLYTGDDAIHADANLTVFSGTIDILKSFEGLESEVVTIHDGNIHIVSSDDGINAAEVDNYLYINGGYVVIDAYGDGIDVNGKIKMTGGTVIINGPLLDLELSVDYDDSFEINGGFFIGTCNIGQAQVPTISSPQSTLLLDFESQLPAGTMVHIQNMEGVNILTFTPSKPCRSLMFSSPMLILRQQYSIFYGGSSSGIPVDGVIQEGTYSPGTHFSSFTLYNRIATIKSDH